jgi:hypothetical protein
MNLKYFTHHLTLTAPTPHNNLVPFGVWNLHLQLLHHHINATRIMHKPANMMQDRDTTQLRSADVGWTQTVVFQVGP